MSPAPSDGPLADDAEVVVVGTSIAGFNAAAELRRAGFGGPIRMVGDEPIRTYERPPLSKGVLAGDDPDTTEWHAATDDDLDLDWMLGERADGLDTERGVVHLRCGDELRYDGLVIASGARPRRLPDQPELTGIHVVRSLDDSLGLRADLEAGAVHVVVVGAGFIGAEVAATCRERGHAVTVVEPLSQPLARVLGPTMGATIADLHRRHDVTLRLGEGVDAIEGDDGAVARVVLSGGDTIDADVVVVGIGVVPNTEWLDGSGLPVDNGVMADSTCMVAPGIVACGDVASWESPRYGRVRIEHWDHAADMGEAAGRRLLSGDDAEAYDPVPWFWSDQYDVRIQMAGRADGEMVVTDGAIDDGKFVALYGKDGWVQGALGWNWPAKTVRYRMALDDGLRWDDAVG